MNATQKIKRCRFCGKLADRESAYQKFGWEENDTHLPKEASCLVMAKDLAPLNERKKQLLMCARCGEFFLYETDYEYLVNGSEDVQTLTRLSIEEAALYMKE